MDILRLVLDNSEENALEMLLPKLYYWRYLRHRGLIIASDRDEAWFKLFSSKINDTTILDLVTADMIALGDRNGIDTADLRAQLADKNKSETTVRVGARDIMQNSLVLAMRNVEVPKCVHLAK